MKNIFSTFESAVPTTYRGYFKGDLLYFKTPLIENGRYVFKPNIVTYAVNINSELGRKISQSKASVVVHREVDSFGNETAITNYNVFQGKELLVIPPISVNNPPDVNENRLKDNSICPITKEKQRADIPYLSYWDGIKDCNSLLIVYEQGIGDNIQYYRFIIQLSQLYPNMKITYFCKKICKKI